MTLKEIYIKGKAILKNACIEDFTFDTMCIFEHCFGVNRLELINKGNDLTTKEKEEEFFNLINQRVNRRPLQYIIGESNFMGNKFMVSEGVLIPRDDTEVLVREVINILGDTPSPKILDLCSGSGAIAISLAKLIKGSEVIALELSEKAYFYLNKNIELNGTNNVKPLILDVLKKNEEDKIEGNFDVIVSNPPYIKTQEIETLQEEVRREPHIALDGGTDGLVFYRAIRDLWANKLKRRGSICVEVGIGQSKDVINIFSKLNPVSIYSLKDINNIDRVVSLKIE